jgi:hypothetical protein
MQKEVRQFNVFGIEPAKIESVAKGNDALVMSDIADWLRQRIQTIELQWILLGIETGKTFWFTAHLGVQEIYFPKTAIQH